MEAGSRNHCSGGKAIIIKYIECVSYPLPYQACRSDLLCAVLNVICGLSGWDRFFHIILSKVRLWGKKLDMKCMFWFSLQLLSETFLILRRIRKDVSICCSFQILVKLYFSRQISNNTPITDVMKIRSLGAESFHAGGRAGGRTWSFWKFFERAKSDVDK